MRRLIICLLGLLFASSAFSQFSGGGGGSTSPDFWIDASQVAVDCTGTNDLTRAIQTWVNSNLSGHLNFPHGCKVKISSTITITSGTGIEFTSQDFVGDSVGTPPTIIWAGTNGGSSCTSTFADCVYMFDFESTDHPVVENIHFYAGTTSSNCPDGFLKFDGHTGSEIGTNGRVRGNNFDNGNCNNANFVAVNISQTTTQNQENYVVDDNVTGCSGLRASLLGRNGITNGTTTLTDTVDAPFNSSEVGKRIRISYAGGLLDTTIASYVSASQVTLTTAPSWSQTGVTIIVGRPTERLSESERARILSSTS